MAPLILRSVLYAVLAFCVAANEIEMEVQSNSVLKMVREMVNQTAAESLNLPANATSIRENITDTFKCENRTYGYYADVDNECQVFHVCVPTQSVTGRNVTYKYSFICPQETVFNQEVLVCARVRDAIPCDESPSFYDLNMEIGKIADVDDVKEVADVKPNKETESVPTKKKQNHNSNRKKQNIIMEALMNEAEEQMDVIEEVMNEPVELDVTESTNSETSKPVIPEYNDEFDDNSRLGLERSVKRTGRKMWRGSMKFKSDV